MIRSQPVTLHDLKRDDPLFAVLASWRNSCSEHNWPHKRDLYPEEFGQALGRVCLVDVLRPGPRFRFRLFGTILAANMGTDMQGQDLANLRPLEYRDMVLADYREAVRRGIPTLKRITSIHNGVELNYLRLILPLINDNGAIGCLLTASSTQDDWGLYFGNEALHMRTMLTPYQNPHAPRPH